MSGSHDNKFEASDQSGASFAWDRRQDEPAFQVTLRPNRSLPAQGLAWILLILWGFLMIPLFPLLGTMALWAMLPFVVFPVIAIWISVKRSNFDGTLREDVRLWPDLVAVTHHKPRHTPQGWSCNPYWVTLKIQPKGGPVDEYITLKGNGRTVELGAFLSPEQRIELHGDLQIALKRISVAL